MRISQADLVLENGKIISMDSRNRIFEAVAAKDGKIVAVTSNKRILRFIGEKTHVIDLAGKAVTPGLIDTHSHFALAGVEMVFIPNLARPEVKRVKDVLNIVRERASQLKKGEWIQARNFEEQRLDEKRSVTRSELDSISPEHPVAIFCEDGHRLIANSLALQLAGVTADTPDPEGFIVKDQNGQLTGLLKDSAAERVMFKIAPWTVEQLEEGMKLAQEEWIRVGLTANKDAGDPRDTSPARIQAYRNLHAKGQLKVRSDVLWYTHEPAHIDRAFAEFRGPADDVLKVGGVKVFLDGAMRTRTAWMYDDLSIDYNRVDTGNKGHPTIDLEFFKNLVLEAHKRGLQVCIHAIGDRAIDTALDAIEQAVKKAPRKDHRHTIIHAEVPTRQALRRMKSLGVAVETQPVLLSMDELAGNMGPKRAKRAFPMKSYMKLGITVGSGSDAIFYPLSPVMGLYWACTRRLSEGRFGPKAFGTSECLTVRQALKTYTTLAAKCLFWEDKIGSIEPGKYADFVVWSEDLYSVPAEKLKDVKAEMTIIGGIVYEAKDSSRLSWPFLS